MTNRTTSMIGYEAQRAMLSVGGVRILKQAKVTVGTLAENSYEVTELATRRCICAFVANDGDIRFEIDATADADSFPLRSVEHFRVDAADGQNLSFYNTSGGGIDVYILEVE